jgi:hypothetical protein
MKNRKLTTHGMSYGELATEACTIVGGVFITLGIVLSAAVSGIATSYLSWIVLGVALVVSIAAALIVWRLGFGSLDSRTVETVVPSILIVGIIVGLSVPMLVGLMLIPAGGIYLVWVFFGLLWTAIAVASVIESIRDWVATGPTSVLLDIVAIVTAIMALASAAWALSIGMAGWLSLIVLLGGVLGTSMGLGFLTAEELVEPAEHLARESETSHTGFGDVVHT